jgi:hypothetical protein
LNNAAGMPMLGKCMCSMHEGRGGPPGSQHSWHMTDPWAARQRGRKLAWDMGLHCLQIQLQCCFGFFKWKFAPDSSCARRSRSSCDVGMHSSTVHVCECAIVLLLFDVVAELLLLLDFKAQNKQGLIMMDKTPMPRKLDATHAHVCMLTAASGKSEPMFSMERCRAWV